MNKRLKKQLEQNNIKFDELPENIQNLFREVAKSYDDFEADGSFSEKSMDLSSQEITKAYAKLRSETDRQKTVLENLKTGIISLQKKDENLSFPEHIADEDLISIPDFLSIQIDKRKNAESKLKLYERAINSSSNGILITDPNLPDNPMVFCNPAFLETTGYSKEEVLGKNCRFLQGDEKNQDGLIILRDAIKQKKPCTVILKNFKKDGTPFWNELKLSPIFDSERNLINFIGIQSDITYRTEAGLELLDSKQRLDAVLNTVGEGIITINSDSEIVMINDEITKIWGYSKEEIVGKTIHMLMPVHHRANHDSGMIRYKMTNTSKVLGNRIELEGMKKDGTIFPLEIKIQETRVKDNIYFTAAVAEISERKKTQSELIELKAFYEQTLGDLSGQVAVFDSNFRYLYVNAMSISDPKLREWIIGKDDYDYCTFRGLDKSIADFRRKWLKAAMNEKKQIRFEEEFRGKDGSMKFFERKISPILNSDKEVIRLVAYGIDISEIKSLVKNLEYSNKALTDFAYIASHDLREPLRKISAFGSLLAKSLAGKLDEDDRENLEFMIDGAKRMQQMVDDLLHYSRITTKAKYYSWINLDDLLNEIIHFDLAQMIEEEGAEIIIQDKLGSIKGEKTQIKQLLQNIVANGIKYRKKSVSPVIKINSRKVGPKIEIQIEDNGIGIKIKYKEQIFEMFKRLHTKEEYEGSGIGLAVCKKIVELYSGDIDLVSEPGVGSKFILRLPIEA